MNRKKKVTNPYKPAINKKPVVAEDPDKGRNKPIVWKFHKMVLDKDRPWNWCRLEESKKTGEVFKKLGLIENKTFNELVADRKHHPIPIEDFKSRKVHKQLELLGIPDVGSLFSLRINGKPRVYCMFSMNQFSLLWYDPNHEIYPSKKKST